VLPVFQGGQLLTTIFFMFIQDPVLAWPRLLYPVRLSHPKLQRKVNQLGNSGCARSARSPTASRERRGAEIHTNDAVACSSRLPR